MPVKWLIFISYYLAVSSLHLRFSMFLDRPLPGTFKNFRVAILVEPLLATLLALVALVVFYQLLKNKRRGSIIFFWGVWLFSVALVDRFLLFKSLEYIHYPQYAILAALLIWVIDPDRSNVCAGRVLFWATVLGIFDEMNQYLFLARNYGDYLDFNDFFLNLQGAAAGVLLVYGFVRQSRDGWQEGKRERLISVEGFLKSVGGSVELHFLMAALLVGGIFMGTGNLRMSPEEIVPPGGMTVQDNKVIYYIERKPGMMGRWNGGLRSPLYYVLSPTEGLLLLFGSGMVFSLFGVLRRR